MNDQDGIYKKLGQKLLMSRLKQEAIRAELAEAQAVAGQFATSFVPPDRELNRNRPSTASSSDPTQIRDDPAAATAETTGAGIEWEDGYADISAGKSLRTRGNNDDDSVQSEEEMEWVRGLA